MKPIKMKKILPIMVSSILILTPCYVHAIDEEENLEATPTPTPTATPVPTATPTATPTPSATPDATIKITLNKENLAMKVGENYTLEVEVDPESSKNDVEWITSDEELATIENGKITAMKTGTVTITAKIDDVKATCKVIITGRDVGKDATLSNLKVSNGTLDKSFKKDQLEYEVTISSKTSTLTIEPTLTDSNAGYLISGNKNLKDGDVVQVVVTAEDGTTTKTYKLTIVKDEINLNLKSLQVLGYQIKESFNADVLIYNVEIPNVVDTITVKAVSEDENNTVTISGGKNLKVGENTINIIVKDKTGNTRTYQVIATRLAEDIEDNTIETVEPVISTITSTGVDASVNDIDSNPSNTSDPFIKYLIVSMACAMLFLIGGIGIYFYMKTSPRKLKKELAKQQNTNDNNTDSNDSLIEVPSSTVEVEELSNTSNVTEEENLIVTKEFNNDELLEPVTEDLFDDE